MEDGGHDHAQLVAADDGQDHCKVLPGDLGGRGKPVPQQKGEKEEEAQQMGPDIESFIVEGEDGSETLAPTLR